MAASSESKASASASPTGIAGVLCIVVGANQPTSSATQSQKVSPNGSSESVSPAMMKCVPSAAIIWQNRIAATTAPEPFSIIRLERLRSVAVIPTSTTAGTRRLACSVSPQELRAMKIGSPTAAPEASR